MPDIRIHNVSFTYAGSSQPVLHSLDLVIPEGEFVLLAGPSGCGKSTLALALAGLIPTRISGRLQGDIYLGDKNMRDLDIHQVAQSIGMVFQNPDNQLIHLDVESEVAFGPENLALPRAEIARRVEQSLAYTGMEGQSGLEIFALSGGQKQRIAISATLAMQPKVLVLDEPTSDLDPIGTQEVLRVLRTLNKEYGMTIVLVEHKIDEVIPWVDRVLLMDQGAVVVDQPPRQAFDNVPLWNQLGVSVPQMVMLAKALPDVFSGFTPLSVDEVYDALRGTDYAHLLRKQNETMRTLDEITLTPLSNNPDSAQSVLDWEHVNLAYGHKRVLNDINLKVMPEEWVAIIGPNGSGKTSLASLAMGFQSPTSGTIRHHSKIVKAGNVSRQAEHMAYLFQAADSMLFGATVEDEFLFGVKHRRKRRQEMPFTLDQLIKMVDLQSYRQTNPFQLSHGQRKRLAIGVLLMRYPDILILDEPTTGQDEGHARVFLQFLQQLREQQHLTYVMITHEMRAVARYASRLVVLRDGQVFMDDVPEVVFAHADELVPSGILPPPIAHLHGRLCEGHAVRVALSVQDFLRTLQPLEVTL